MSVVHGITVATALLATTASTLSVYPHQFAYFNELAGGPENGHKHLLHSNLDWGQDFLSLKAFLSAQGEHFDKYVVPSRFYDPTKLGLRCELLDMSDFPPLQGPGTALVAVSIRDLLRGNRCFQIGEFGDPNSLQASSFSPVWRICFVEPKNESSRWRR